MFKQRKNKTFNYQSKFSKEVEENAVSDEKETRDFVRKWRQRSGNRVRMKGILPARTLILALVLLLLCMYLLEKKYI